MELGRRIGIHVPDEGDIHILAVEISDNLTFGERLLPELEAALPDLVRPDARGDPGAPRHADGDHPEAPLIQLTDVVIDEE